MKKLIVFIILVAFLGGHAQAGENQDKRKRKAQEQYERNKRLQEEAEQARFRDMRAEDELYKEIQAQERLLSHLRRKLSFLHNDNLKKYGQQYFPKEQVYMERDEDQRFRQY